MMTQNTSNAPSGRRRFFTISLGVYFGLAIPVIILAMIGGSPNIVAIGNALLWTGLACMILSFVFMGTGGGEGRSGAMQSPRIRSDEEFKAWRKRERPIELVAWAIILGGFLTLTTGYILLQIS